MQAILRERKWPVLLYGGVGCGKTHAAACVYRMWRVSENRIGTIRWFRCDNLVDDILKARFGDGITVWLDTGDSVRMTEPGIFASFTSADFVVLDDLGTSEIRADRYSVLLRLIDSRVGRPTLITSNLDPEGLAKVFDDRIASRLIAGTVLHATGDDRRIDGSNFVEA